MKTIKSVIAILLALILALPIVFGTLSFNAEETLEPEYKTFLTMKSGTPTIDGNISASEYSANMLVNSENTVVFWGTNPACYISANTYFAYDTTNFYFAAEITDPNFVIGTDKTDGGSYEPDDYGYYGDVFAFAIDPTSVFFQRGYAGFADKAATYSVSVFEGNVFKMYRGFINAGDITADVKGNASVTSTGWKFECQIPWAIILEDAESLLMGEYSFNNSELYAPGAIHRAEVTYYDRALKDDTTYVSAATDGAVKIGGSEYITFNRYITVCGKMASGQDSNQTPGSSICAYGIKMSFADASGSVPATAARFSDSSSSDTTTASTSKSTKSTASGENESSSTTVSTVKPTSTTASQKKNQALGGSNNDDSMSVWLIIAIIVAVIAIAAAVFIIIKTKKKQAKNEKSAFSIGGKKEDKNNDEDNKND